MPDRLDRDDRARLLDGLSELGYCGRLDYLQRARTEAVARLDDLMILGPGSDSPEIGRCQVAELFQRRVCDLAAGTAPPDRQRQ